MNLDTILLATGSAAAGGGVAGGLGMWFFQRWINKVDSRLDRMELKFNEFQVSLAKQEGKEELVWREINTDKVKIANTQKEMNKLWHIIHKIAAKLGIETKRISDLIDETLEGHP